MLIQKMSQLPLLKSIPKLIAVDTETENKSGGIEGYSFSYLSKNKKLKGYYIPINHLFGDDEKYVNVNFNSGVKYLEQLVKGRRVVFHNAQFDLTILEEECGIQIPNEMVEDTLLIHWLLDTERLHGLKPIMRDEYGQNVVTYDEARAQSFAEFAKYGSNDSMSVSMVVVIANPFFESAYNFHIASFSQSDICQHVIFVNLLSSAKACSKLLSC